MKNYNNISNFNEEPHLYRVDKFIVPNYAREEFLNGVKRTHSLLRTVSGFIRDKILEETTGPGEFNFVTIVEWENMESINKAKILINEMQKKENYSPQEILKRNKIKADIAYYKEID